MLYGRRVCVTSKRMEEAELRLCPFSFFSWLPGRDFPAPLFVGFRFALCLHILTRIGSPIFRSSGCFTCAMPELPSLALGWRALDVLCAVPFVYRLGAPGVMSCRQAIRELVVRSAADCALWLTLWDRQGTMFAENHAGTRNGASGSLESPRQRGHSMKCQIGIACILLILSRSAALAAQDAVQSQAQDQAQAQSRIQAQIEAQDTTRPASARY